MYELKLINVDKPNVLVGIDIGLKFRKELDLDKLEKEDKKINLKIDDKIISLSQSFILGLFKDSMNVLETKEDFYNKYNFKCDEYIIKDIDDSVGWMYEHKNFYLKRIKKVGRPKKDNPKNKQYRLRMTEEEIQDLKSLSKQINLSEADIIRTALKEFKEKRRI